MKRPALLLALCLLLAVTARGGDPYSEDSSEYVIKAGYIYNFAKLVDWPASSFPRADSPIVIGIIGKDSFDATLDQVLSDKKVNGRRFEIRHLKRGSDMKECQILLVSPSESAHLDEVLHMVNELPVLTIGETPAFAEHGGIINLVVEQNRVRFEVNIEAARKSDLNISSRLLSLARVVH